MTMQETITGAKNRAAAALAAVLAEPAGQEGVPSLSFGIESGLFSPDGGATYFDVCAVSLYDGADHHIGFSSAFQIPPAVARFVLEEGKDLSQATNAAGLIDDPKLGEGQAGRSGLSASSPRSRASPPAMPAMPALSASLRALSAALAINIPAAGPSARPPGGCNVQRRVCSAPLLGLQPPPEAATW